MKIFRSDNDNRTYIKDLRQHLGWLHRIRPNTLAGPLYRQFGPYERRVVVNVDGIFFFCDPLSYTAKEIIERDCYEPETTKLLRELLKPGDTFIDIGANEGYVSAVAASIVGSAGTVVAVEPQTAVYRVLEANLAMNRPGSAKLFNKAIGDSPGKAVINLWPRVNSGGSSLVRRPRFGRTEPVSVIDFATLMKLSDISGANVVKVDVEGYEPEVVRSIIGSGFHDQIRILMIDYHNPVLVARGISPHPIHSSLLQAGFDAPAILELDGYVVYRRV